MTHYNKVVLVGEPNSGKTTTFNNLTGKNEHVGNWHGVTVEKSVGILNYKNKKFEVVDLPGLYSLNHTTLEEKISSDYVKNSKDIIVVIAECNSLASSLNLLKEVYAVNQNVILVINMYKEFVKNDGYLNVNELKKQLGIEVIVAEMNTKQGINKLKEAIINFTQNTASSITYNLQDFFVCAKIKESKIDKILLNKFLAFPFLILIMLTVFFVSFSKFGIGVILSDFLTQVFLRFKVYMQALLNKSGVNLFLQGLILNGVFNGVLQVVSFLPQTLIFTFALLLLELSGYMARVAYLFDGLLKNTGLNGRAVFSILSGFGCTAIGVFTTSGLENISVKKKAVFTLSGVACSAKIPVLMLISKNVHIISPLLFMLIIYAFGLLFTFFQIILADKFIVKGKRVPLVIEVPPYRFPPVKLTLKSLLKSAKQFIIKISTIVFLISITVHLLNSVTVDFRFSNGNYQNTLLYYLGNSLSFLLYPIGIKNGKISTALLAGIFAKEGIASVLISLFPNGLDFSPYSLIALAVFIYTYSPCITALGACVKEVGFKFALIVFIVTTVESLVLSYTVYALLKYNFTVIILLIIVALYIAYEKFLCRKRNKTVKISS